MEQFLMQMFIAALPSLIEGGTNALFGDGSETPDADSPFNIENFIDRNRETGANVAELDAEKSTTEARNQSEAIETALNQYLGRVLPQIEQLQNTNENALNGTFRNAFTSANTLQNARNSARGILGSDLATASSNNLFNNFVAGQASALNDDRFRRSTAALSATQAIPIMPFVDPANLQFTEADRLRNRQFGADFSENRIYNTLAGQPGLINMSGLGTTTNNGLTGLGPTFGNVLGSAALNNQDDIISGFSSFFNSIINGSGVSDTGNIGINTSPSVIPSLYTSPRFP